MNNCTTAIHVHTILTLWYRLSGLQFHRMSSRCPHWLISCGAGNEPEPLHEHFLSWNLPAGLRRLQMNYLFRIIWDSEIVTSQSAVRLRLCSDNRHCSPAITSPRHICQRGLEAWATRGPQQSAGDPPPTLPATGSELLFTISCERMQGAISVRLSRNPSKPRNHRPADWCLLTPEDWLTGHKTFKKKKKCVTWQLQKHSVIGAARIFPSMSTALSIHPHKRKRVKSVTRKCNIKADSRGFGWRIRRAQSSPAQTEVGRQTAV